MIEQEMDVQLERFNSLNDYGQELVQSMDASSDAVGSINKKLMDFQERWDHMVQLMGQQSKQVCKMQKN